MGLAHMGAYRKLTNEDSNSLSMEDEILRLRLEMEIMEYKMKQMELLTRSQRQEETSCCNHNVESSKEKIKQNSSIKSMSSIRDEEMMNQESLNTALTQLASCEYYHGDMSWQQSWSLLNPTNPGTFLIRKSQSQNPRFPFALSFSRQCEAGGATSIRVCLARGEWSLDCEDQLNKVLPSFSDIPALIQYYQDKNNCLVSLSRGLKKI